MLAGAKPASRLALAADEARPQPRRPDRRQLGRHVRSSTDGAVAAALAQSRPRRLDQLPYLNRHPRRHGFYVFAAISYETPPGGTYPRPVVHHLQAFGRKDTAAWEEFFRSLPGTPEILISDLDGPIRLAARNVFSRIGDRRPIYGCASSCALRGGRGRPAIKRRPLPGPFSRCLTVRNQSFMLAASSSALASSDTRSRSSMVPNRSSLGAHPRLRGQRHLERSPAAEPAQALARALERACAGTSRRAARLRRRRRV